MVEVFTFVRRPGVGMPVLAALAICLCRVAITHAQEAEPPRQPTVAPVVNQLTLETVQERQKGVDNLTQLDEVAREELRGIYQEAIQHLTTAQEFEKQADEFAKMASDAAENLQRVEADLANGQMPPLEVPADATLEKLRSLLDAEKQQAVGAKTNADKLHAEPGRRESRQSEIAERERIAKELRDKLATELAALDPQADFKSAAIATRLQANIQLLDAEVELYSKELAAYAATGELLGKETSLAERDLTWINERVQQWDQLVESRLREEGNALTARAQRAMERATGALRELALDNTELADENEKLAGTPDKPGVPGEPGKIQKTKNDIEQSRELLEKLEKKFEVTRDTVERVGLNYATGLLLRREQAAPPDVRQYRQRSKDREETIRGVELRRIELDVALNDEDFAKEFMDGVESLPKGVSREQFEDEVNQLVDARLELLRTLQGNQDAYFEQLVELEATERDLQSAAEDYRDYIDERVLWIRSSEPLAWGDLRHSFEAIRHLVAPADWRVMSNNAWARVKENQLAALLVTLTWLVLLGWQRALRRAITRVGNQASSGSCRSFQPTSWAFIWTTLIAVLWPSLLFLFAWMLVGLTDHYSVAIGMGLRTAGILYVTLDLLRQVCRSKGLADSHFMWPQGVRVTLRKNLRWFMVVSIPLVFVAAVLYADAGLRSQDELATSQAFESAARSFVLGVLVAAGVFTHRVLWSKGLLFRSLAESHAESWVYRRRRGIYYTVQLVFGLLVVLALIGYDYTVAQLATMLYMSVLLIEILIVGVAFANRWLMIARRRMAIEQAQQRRAQLTQHSEAAGDLAGVAIAEETPDLSQMNQQSQRLLRSIVTLIGLIGFWYIWSDVVPALNFLEQFELWPATDGGKAVTINDAVIAAVVVVVTILATKNIPGLLEIVVLSRLPLDTGNRYAIITICRYVLTIVGVVLAFAAIGVNWSQIQWLVAAVTVGLGFGLQEIFANFVSGLIVLFEQPIRVGDVVTIGDVTGVVSRIRMRATTVTNWDRQEFIVPNKEFITGKLLNWTLSNTINRVVITVGVAYGTDPDKVRRIMLDIASEHQLVMLDPEPSVTFEQFGDSTLNVILRCFLPDMDGRLATIHELNTEVQKRLNAAGIEFAFPTRELYIRSTTDVSTPAPGGEEEVEPGTSGTAG